MVRQCSCDHTVARLSEHTFIIEMIRPSLYRQRMCIDIKNMEGHFLEKGNNKPIETYRSLALTSLTEWFCQKLKVFCTLHFI